MRLTEKVSLFCMLDSLWQGFSNIEEELNDLIRHIAVCDYGPDKEIQADDAEHASELLQELMGLKQTILPKFLRAAFFATDESIKSLEDCFEATQTHLDNIVYEMLPIGRP